MTRRHVMTSAASVVVLGLMTSGCLQKEVTQTWMLQLDAGVNWQVTERYVRSDADTAADRQNEEATYITGVRAQAHPVALGLERLGGMTLLTRALRSQAPFAIVTEAGFVDIGQLGRQILAVANLPGTSVLERTLAGSTWTLSILDTSGNGDADVNGDESIDALMAGFEHLQVVLVNGHFTSAEGFALSSDKRVASLTALDDEADTAEQKTLTMSLSWTR